MTPFETPTPSDDVDDPDHLGPVEGCETCRKRAEGGYDPTDEES